MNSDFNDIIRKISHTNVCRLCLGVEDVQHSLYENNGQLIKKLDVILPIKLSENEGLPEKICKKCYENIEIVENFYSTVCDAENKLLNYITNKNQEESYNVENHEIDNICLNADIIETNDLYENNYLSDCNEEKIEIKESDILDDKPFLFENLEINPGIEIEINKKEKEKHKKQFHCITCNATLVSQKELEEHYKNHLFDDDNIPLSIYKQKKIKTEFAAQSTVDMSKKEYICGTCNKKFSSRKGITQHSKLHSNGGFVCEICNYYTKRLDNMNVHKKLHMPPFGYWCEYCKTGFNVKSWLYRHMKQHPQYLKCEQCDITFTKRQHFINHKFNQHTSNDLRSEFKCDLCPYNTNVKGKMKEHMKLHMPPYKYFCKFCNEGYNLRSWLLKHESTHPEHLTCQLCQRSFTTKLKLLSHIHNNHKVKETPYRYKCKPCSLEWNHSRQLYRHNVHVHGHPPDFMCDVCGRKFINSDRFKIHRRIHSGIKPYKCGYCEKAFVSKPLLVEHIRVHTGEKPYKCNECTKAFSQKSSLTIHKRLHTGERPFECTKCLKTFVAQGLLTTHEKKCLYWDKSQILTKKHKDMEIK